MSTPPPELPAPAARAVAGLDARELMAAAIRTSPASSPVWAWNPPPPEEIAPLFPEYTIEALIGRGGMGAVYRAVQHKLDRPVAIKLLPAELAAQGDLAARFEREARSLAKLSHPNIVLLYDYGRTAAGQLYIIMEYVDGTDLGHLIHAGGDGPKLDVPRTLEIVRQICDALQYAHGRGLVHRDIKPGNVLVDRSGCVKVADFGLAKILGTPVTLAGHTVTGAMIGTPEYVAPEQLRGGEVDHRADIYSLGVMFYEMLTGDLPRGAWQPPSQRVPAASVRMDEVVTRAMQQEPDRRYQQASEVKGALEPESPRRESRSGGAAWKRVLKATALYLGVAVVSCLGLVIAIGPEWPGLLIGAKRDPWMMDRPLLWWLATVLVLSAAGVFLTSLRRTFFWLGTIVCVTCIVFGLIAVMAVWTRWLDFGRSDENIRLLHSGAFWTTAGVSGLGFVSLFHFSRGRMALWLPVLSAALITVSFGWLYAGDWVRGRLPVSAPAREIAQNAPEPPSPPPVVHSPEGRRVVVLPTQMEPSPSPAPGTVSPQAQRPPANPAPVVGALPAPAPLPAEPTAEALIARGKEIGVTFVEREGHWYAVVRAREFASAALSSPEEFEWAAKTFAADASSDPQGLLIGASDDGKGWQWSNGERWSTIPWAAGEPLEPPAQVKNSPVVGWAVIRDGKVYSRYGGWADAMAARRPQLFEWKSLKDAWDFFPRVAWAVRQEQVCDLAYELRTTETMQLLEHTLLLPEVRKLAEPERGPLGSQVASPGEHLQQLLLFFEIVRARPAALSLVRHLPSTSKAVHPGHPVTAVWKGHTYAVIPHESPSWPQVRSVAEKLGAVVWCPETKEEMEAVPKALHLDATLFVHTGAVAEGEPAAWRWLSGAKFEAGYERTTAGKELLPEQKAWLENYTTRAGDRLLMAPGTSYHYGYSSIFFKPVNLHSNEGYLAILEWPALPQDIKPAAQSGSSPEPRGPVEVKPLPREQNVLVFPQNANPTDKTLPVLSDEEFAAILTEFGLERKDRDGHVYVAGVLPWGLFPMDPATLDSAEEFVWAAKAFSKWCVDGGGKGDGLAFGACDYGSGWQWMSKARWDGIPWAEGEPVKPPEGFFSGGAGDYVSEAVGLALISGDRCRAHFEKRPARVSEDRVGRIMRPAKARAVLVEWDTPEKAKEAVREWAPAAMIDKARQILSTGDTEAARALLNRMLPVPAVAAEAGRSTGSNEMPRWQSRIGALRDAILLMTTCKETPAHLPLLPGVIEYGGQTYAVVRRLRWSWDEASRFAATAGAGLVAWESWDEESFVVSALTDPSEGRFNNNRGTPPADYFLAAEVTEQAPWFRWPGGGAFQAWHVLVWPDGTRLKFPEEFKWPDGSKPNSPGALPLVHQIPGMKQKDHGNPGKDAVLRHGSEHPAFGWVIESKDTAQGTLLLEWPRLFREDKK